jgi:hypothetical protein
MASHANIRPPDIARRLRLGQVEDVIVAALESAPGKDTHWSRVSSAAVCCGMLAGGLSGGQD